MAWISRFAVAVKDFFQITLEGGQQKPWIRAGVVRRRSPPLGVLAYLYVRQA